jgi:hypothetical protein
VDGLWTAASGAGAFPALLPPAAAAAAASCLARGVRGLRPREDGEARRLGLALLGGPAAARALLLFLR